MTSDAKRIEDLEAVVAELARRQRAGRFYWPDRGPLRRILLRVQKRESWKVER